MRSGFYLFIRCWLVNIHKQICSCTFVVGVHIRMSMYPWLCRCTYAYSLVYVCISYMCMAVCVHTCVCIDFSYWFILSRTFVLEYVLT